MVEFMVGVIAVILGVAGIGQLLDDEYFVGVALIMVGAALWLLIVV